MRHAFNPLKDVSRIDLGGDWACQCKIAFEDGQPVVEELRIHPTKDMPRGGLSTRTLREVKLGEHLAIIRTLLEEEARGGTEGSAIPPAPGRPGGLKLSGADMGRAIAEDAGFDTTPKRRRRGRPGRPDAFYAEVARDYLRALAEGSRRPTADVAAERSYSAAHVRDALHTARERGLLTRSAKGRAGGQLTEKAKALLGEPSKFEDSIGRAPQRAEPNHRDDDRPAIPWWLRRPDDQEG